MAIVWTPKLPCTVAMEKAAKHILTTKFKYNTFQATADLLNSENLTIEMLSYAIR